MDIEDAFTNGEPKSYLVDKKNKEPTVTINDFTLLCVIGKGSYAKVILVRKKDTKEVLALKVLKKKYIQQKNQRDHVQTERYVLVIINFRHYLISPRLTCLIHLSSKWNTLSKTRGNYISLLNTVQVGSSSTFYRKGGLLLKISTNFSTVLMLKTFFSQGQGSMPLKLFSRSSICTL